MAGEEIKKIGPAVGVLERVSSAHTKAFEYWIQKSVSEHMYRAKTSMFRNINQGAPGKAGDSRLVGIVKELRELANEMSLL
ncbi:hypothetical protein HO133_007732 [Letharia lupina]|uniref:Uncharacterized protein n=1 Tax=Letharia lupina TaxID=560253 RepID=A0A8H6FHI0_9LECA|nr:uncharacterized protein HO133_007732 [Letharia lupina]KAF6228004.1 hypothetical protein HO133_007732 [Letharia lupina]